VGPLIPHQEKVVDVTKIKYDIKGKKHQLSLLLAFIYLFILIYPINAMATGCTPMVQFLAGTIFFSSPLSELALKLTYSATHWLRATLSPAVKQVA